MPHHDRHDEQRHSAAADPQDGPLLDAARTEVFRHRWEEVQTHFVDEPRLAVREADQLVGEIMTALEDTFTAHKRELESSWDRGEDADTETLRLTLQKYRRLFGRLLVT